MMSIPRFRTSDAGRNIENIVWEPEEHVIKYQLGHNYRVPLWELVYHDCAVAYWYWGDYNNKMPTLWDKRDLFNALYGVPPMYVFGLTSWNEKKKTFQRIYHRASPVAHLTMFYEMFDHLVLTEDWLVQQTIYANSVRSTVNFGKSSFTMDDLYVLEPNSIRIETQIDVSKYTGKSPSEDDSNNVAVYVIVPLVVVAIVVAAGVAIFIFIKRRKNTYNDEVISEAITV
jgi:hypothetical protein